MNQSNTEIGVSCQLINLNPAPIGMFKLPPDKHQEYKEYIYEIYKSAPQELRQKSPSDFTEHICNSNNQNIFNSYPKLSELKYIISEMIISYIKNIGYLADSVVNNDAWLNNASKNARLPHHYHPNSYISGNYFVN